MKNTFYNRACPPSRMFGSRRGMTVIEIFVIIAVVGVLLLIVLPQFSKTRENQVLKSAVADVLSSLDKARSQTLASFNSAEYGVRFEASQVIIFKGTTFSSGAAENEAMAITSPAGITNVTLNSVSGASGDMYFNRLSGSPSKSGMLTLSTDSYSKIITIGATGAVSSN